MTLPSNVKSNLFKNTVANFKTQLAQRLVLDGDWEVGLSTISYTNSWLNIPEKQVIYFKYWYKGKTHYIHQAVVIKKEMYTTIEKLVDEINKEIKKIEAIENDADHKVLRYLRENPHEYITDGPA